MHFIWTLVSVACVISMCVGTSRPSKYYITDSCQNYKRLVVGDELIAISRLPLLLPRITCKLKLQPYSGDGIVARVVSYHISPVYADKELCPFESIQLANASDPFLFGNISYCRSYAPKGQFQLGSVGFFSFKTGNYSHLITPDISLLVTEWFDKNITGHCNSGQFDCQRDNICIATSLTCNGYDDCGNSMDENNCGMSPGKVAGAVLGTIALFCFFMFCTCCRGRIFRRRHQGYVQHR